MCTLKVQGGVSHTCCKGDHVRAIFDLIAVSIYDKYCEGPSVRSIRTRCCFAMTDVIQACSKPPKVLRGGISKSILKRPCQFLAINAHKMAPRTNQWLQERTWDTPTYGLLWFHSAGVFIIYTCPDEIAGSVLTRNLIAVFDHSGSQVR